MTPEQYREKWGLPPDYPMVAPNYAAARSQLAKQMGLGQQRRRREVGGPASNPEQAPAALGGAFASCGRRHTNSAIPILLLWIKVLATRVKTLI